VLPLQNFAPGMHLLQLPAVALQSPAPQFCCSAKSDPSPSQTLSVDPSELHVGMLGMHTISVHAPAPSWQSAAEAQISFSTHSPSSEHCLSCSASHKKVSGTHCAQAPLVAPI
jgi:hypothetical protein